jgi:hypothetical protein
MAKRGLHSMLEALKRLELDPLERNMMTGSDMSGGGTEHGAMEPRAVGVYGHTDKGDGAFDDPSDDLERGDGGSVLPPALFDENDDPQGNEYDWTDGLDLFHSHTGHDFDERDPSQVAIESAWYSREGETVSQSLEQNEKNQEEASRIPPGAHMRLWENSLKKPPIWRRISDPNINKLILPSTNWKYVYSASDPLFVPEETKGNRSKDDIWKLDRCDSILPYVSKKTKESHSLDSTSEDGRAEHIPYGLHVFKPLLPELFPNACKDLRNLYTQEDECPTPECSPDRMDNPAIPRKTMLFYSYKDKDMGDGTEHFIPQRPAHLVVEILRRKGFKDLADYVMGHISALAHATQTDPARLLAYGSVMFLRYAPNEGFYRHIDGTSTLGSVPGPILNVTMGTEGRKPLDFTPILRYREPNKYPLRVWTEAGEAILMWGESRVEWSHCVAGGDRTWRFTMAIKHPGPLGIAPNLNVLEHRTLFPDKNNNYRIIYDSYDLFKDSFVNVKLSDDHRVPFVPPYNARKRFLVVDDDSASVASTNTQASGKSSKSHNGFMARNGKRGQLFYVQRDDGQHRDGGHKNNHGSGDGGHLNRNGGGGWQSHGRRGDYRNFNRVANGGGGGGKNFHNGGGGGRNSFTSGGRRRNDALPLVPALPAVPPFHPKGF